MLKNFDYKNIHNLNTKELQNLSNDIRDEIIDACSKNGGHLASSLGVVEAIVAMHKSFDFPKDKVIFDVGHQAYAHKILSGRDLSTLRQKDGISGFQKRSESEFDPYEAGHSSTSISACMGMAYKRDLDKDDYNIISFIGDSAISNGLSFEALNQLSEFGHKVIIILNDNNMSISKANGALHNYLQRIRASKFYFNKKTKLKDKKSKIGKFFYKLLRSIKNFVRNVFIRENLFENMGLYFIGPVDGYNFKKMSKAFEKAKKAKSSVVINIHTKKGKGYKYSEMDNDGFWHGVGPFNKETGIQNKQIAEKVASWSKIYADSLDKVLSENKNAILITPATTVGSSLSNIYSKYKNQCIDVGIGEEHAVILSSGMAASGLKPYVSIYSTFLQRTYDEISHDVCRMDLPVTFLIDRAGLIGPDGETHQGIYDASMLLSIPNASIFMASNAKEANGIIEFSKTFNHPLFIRYSKTDTAIENGCDKIEYGKWIRVKNTSKDTCIITLGDKVNKLINLDVTLINACWINPIDKELLNSLKSYKNIIVYDPYSTFNALSSSITTYLSTISYSGNLKVFCCNNDFIAQATVEEQEQSMNISTNDVINYINSL